MSLIKTYIGTYTKKEGHVDGKADGFYSADFDTETGALAVSKAPFETTNPSYLSIHPNGESVYIANEMFEDLCSPHAILSAFRVGDNGAGS